MRNLLTKVPKRAQGLVATLVRSIFAQPTAKEVWAQHERVCEELARRFPQTTEMLQDAAEDILAFTTFPQAVWRQIWSKDPQERVNREVDRDSIIRLVGAVLAEYNDEWMVSRRYVSIGVLQKANSERMEETATEAKELVAQLTD